MRMRTAGHAKWRGMPNGSGWVGSPHGSARIVDRSSVCRFCRCQLHGVWRIVSGGAGVVGGRTAVPREAECAAGRVSIPAADGSGVVCCVALLVGGHRSDRRVFGCAPGGPRRLVGRHRRGLPVGGPQRVRHWEPGDPPGGSASSEVSPECRLSQLRSYSAGAPSASTLTRQPRGGVQPAASLGPLGTPRRPTAP
jgi:hypothetical protein